MTQLESFVIDGVTFTLDHRPGKDRGQSQDTEFVLVKTQELIRFYRTLQENQPKDILEVGMFEGGSLVLFDKLYEPNRLVGIDIRRDPIDPLERYRESRKHISTRYGLSQSAPELASILRSEFPEGIDLIVDDASHHYGLSRKTFHSCFPLLKSGGMYVIEDWSWSHKPPSQSETHPWFDKPALTNLITDLLINIPKSEHIDRMIVRTDVVMIEKAAPTSGKEIDLDDGHNRLRGRRLSRL